MKPYLLDTNVLIALAWPNHVHHAEALAWFQTRAALAFRTCPLTQTGFVRISSNPGFSENPPSPHQALQLFKRITELPGHDFWPDDLALTDAFATGPLMSHRHVTVGYLLALAARHDGVLATLDRGVRPLARSSLERLELIFG